MLSAQTPPHVCKISGEMIKWNTFGVSILVALTQSCVSYTGHWAHLWFRFVYPCEYDSDQMQFFTHSVSKHITHAINWFPSPGQHSYFPPSRPGVWKNVKQSRFRPSWSRTTHEMLVKFLYYRANFMIVNVPWPMRKLPVQNFLTSWHAMSWNVMAGSDNCH